MTSETPSENISSLDSYSDDEMQEEIMFAKRGCCFWMPCIGSDRSSAARSNWWEPIEKDDRRWWSKGLDAFKKMREWSELVAGPKWKTFIRRFNRSRQPKSGKFQYDPLSYALNFDHGPGQNGDFDDDDRACRDFSSRYASIPISAKSSMDLGKDGPAFT